MNRSTWVQACFGAIVVIALIRAVVLFEPLPGWDTNPLNNVSAILGLGPTAYLALDAIACLASAVLCWLLGSRLAMAGLLSLLGAVAVAVHTVAFEQGNAEPVAIAGAWTSGAAMLAAASASASRPSLRRAGLAVLAGFICILLAKGAGQLLVEHPSVVRTFESDPKAALAARGYTPGSASALQFERRLRQPDVTGWFGLSNIVAAYLAAGAVAFGLLALQSRRCLGSWAWWFCAALVVLCWIGITATGSKAGLAIAAAGSVAVVATHLILLLTRDGRWSRRAVLMLALGVWALPVIAIAGRAVLLPHEGELSLLFRYFYIDAAIDIAKNSLPSGTGIDGFRAAYAVAKPPIAPETVTSSHNVLTDWFAMLGAFGLPLAVAAVVAAWAISGSLTTRSQPCSQSAHISRPTVLCLGPMLAIPVITSAAIESAGALIELAVLRLVGLAAGVAVAVAVWKLRPTRAVSAVFGLVLLTHAQLDMVLFHPGSIPLAMLAIGLALPARRPSRWRAWAAVLPMVCGVVMAISAWSTWRWEGPLRRAFDAGQRIAMVGERARSGSGTARAEFPAVLAANAPIVRAGLREAAEAMPRDPRAWLCLTEVELTLGGPSEAAWEAAKAAVQAERAPATLSRLASVARLRADQAANASERVFWIEASREPLLAAAELDPHGPHFPAMIAELEAYRGRAEAASVWAVRALQSDENYSLDPTAGLPDDRRQRLESLVGDTQPGS
ncbi:MAG: hypothetical protein AAFS11_08215 [Planctomycetota bacterium]